MRTVAAMLGVYLFCLGIGGVLLLASFFADADAPDDLGDSAWQQLLSLRNFTYFLFVFGAIGSLMAWRRGGSGGLGGLLLAAGSGVLIAAVVHFVFAYLRRTDTAEVASDRDLVGRLAQVTLPVGTAGIGKIELDFGGQRVELLARPFDAEREGNPAIQSGSQVVIVEMVAGTALVSPASME